MSEGGTNSKRLPLNAIIVSVLVVMTPVLYVLSVGPAQIVAAHFPGLHAALEVFYRPLTYLMSYSDMARRWIEAYSDLWR
jgi:hypothetical protein